MLYRIIYAFALYKNSKSSLNKIYPTDTFVLTHMRKVLTLYFPEVETHDNDYKSCSIRIVWKHWEKYPWFIHPNIHFGVTDFAVSVKLELHSNIRLTTYSFHVYDWLRNRSVTENYWLIKWKIFYLAVFQINAECKQMQMHLICVFLSFWICFKFYIPFVMLL